MNDNLLSTDVQAKLYTPTEFRDFDANPVNYIFLIAMAESPCCCFNQMMSRLAEFHLG